MYIVLLGVRVWLMASETIEARRQLNGTFKVLKEKQSKTKHSHLEFYT